MLIGLSQNSYQTALLSVMAACCCQVSAIPISLSETIWGCITFFSYARVFHYSKGHAKDDAGNCSALPIQHYSNLHETLTRPVERAGGYNQDWLATPLFFCAGRTSHPNENSDDTTSEPDVFPGVLALHIRAERSEVLRLG